MLMESLQRPASSRVTPKMFTYNIKTTCAANPQHIVLPEGLDKRILAAAAEVTQRGLAKVTLLGDPELVNAGGAVHTVLQYTGHQAGAAAPAAEHDTLMT